jgi:outer membrane protein assembly factor BamB
MKQRPLLICAVFLACWVLPARADDWPQWRGPNRDGVSKETGLLQEWPKGGPKLVWKATGLGSGWSTPSIARGQVYLIGSPDGNSEHVIALDEKDGTKKLWSRKIGAVGPNKGQQYPGPRSTPTVDGDRVYALGSDGDLVCLDAAKGEIVWKKNLRTDFGGQPGNWAYAESPLVDGDVVVACPGGKKATMVALNKTDGKMVWQCAVPGGDAAAYASVVIGEVDGIRQYIQFLGKGVVGVEAKSGRFLWRYDKTSNGISNIPTPVFHDGEVLSTAQKTGAGLVKLTAAGDKVTATQVYFNSKLQTHIGGVVVVNDYIYGANEQALLCLDFQTGKEKWQDRSVGKGSLCYADGCLYVRGQNGGAVALVEANPAAYKEKGRFTPPGGGGKNVWAYPVVANGCLYLRDQGILYCYDVKAAK